MGIWKNIGKIVILLFQIVHEQVKWYIGTWTRVKRVSPKREQKNIHPRERRKKRNEPNEYESIYLDEQQESIQRSKVMLSQYDYEQVEWSENPHIHLQKNEDS